MTGEHTGSTDGLLDHALDWVSPLHGRLIEPDTDPALFEIVRQITAEASITTVVRDEDGGQRSSTFALVCPPLVEPADRSTMGIFDDLHDLPEGESLVLRRKAVGVGQMR